MGNDKDRMIQNTTKIVQKGKVIQKTEDLSSYSEYAISKHKCPANDPESLKHFQNMKHEQEGVKLYEYPIIKNENIEKRFKSDRKKTFYIRDILGHEIPGD